MIHEEEIAGLARLVNSWRTDAKRYESALKTARSRLEQKLECNNSIVNFITNVLEGGVTVHEGVHPVAEALYVQGLSIEKRISNARLISAAPDLLEALEAIISGDEIRKLLQEDYSMFLENAEDAIKKARGL